MRTVSIGPEYLQFRETGNFFSLEHARCISKISTKQSQHSACEIFAFNSVITFLQKINLKTMHFYNFFFQTIKLPETPAAERVSQNIFPLQLFLFRS